MEWLYHLGVPIDEIEDIAENSCNTVPVMMPYVTAFFMPRQAGDRPDVVPNGAVNFAFLGQFAETKRDTIFTTEYSIRTGMEAVYTLLGIDRGVPEVWGSTYDIRDLLNATIALRDGKPLTADTGLLANAAIKPLLKKIHSTDIEKLLLRYNVIGLPESDEENVSERHINKKNFVKAGAGAVAVGTAIAVAKKVKNKKK